MNECFPLLPGLSFLGTVYRALKGGVGGYWSFCFASNTEASVFLRPMIQNIFTSSYYESTWPLPAFVNIKINTSSSRIIK